MSETPRYSIGTIAFRAALLAGAIGPIMGVQFILLRAGLWLDANVIVICVPTVMAGIIGMVIGVIPGSAFFLVLRRFYREESLGTSSHRAFWMGLAFGSSAILSAAVEVWLCWIARW